MFGKPPRVVIGRSAVAGASTSRYTDVDSTRVADYPAGAAAKHYGVRENLAR